VIVRFVDIGGIDDHQCLNFSFINLLLVVNQSESVFLFEVTVGQ
jgi:hypothetical protein